MAIGLLVVGGAYDAFYFMNKPKKGASHASAATPDQRAPAAAAPEPSLVETIDAVHAQIALTAPVGARVEHHPFLSALEEQRGLPYEKILKEREEKLREERERAERQKPKAAKPKERKDDNPIDKFKLKAVLVQSGGAVALLNEFVLRVGDRLPGTQWTVEAIENDMVRVRRAKESRELRLDRPEAKAQDGERE
ncbi:MAG: hypothetical protein U1E76_05645 [Planctomycetota bacterium]